MSHDNRVRSKAEVIRLLRRVGFSPEDIKRIVIDLPDPVELGQVEHSLAREGIDRERLMDWLGASP